MPQLGQLCKSQPAYCSKIVIIKTMSEGLIPEASLQERVQKETGSG